MYTFAPVIAVDSYIICEPSALGRRWIRLPISLMVRTLNNFQQDKNMLEEGKKMCKGEHKWTVVRTFNRHELVISDFLKQEGLTCFIPMLYQEKVIGDDPKPKRVMVPVIHNFVFVQLSIPMKQLCALLANCNTPLYVLKARDADEPVEISNREMVEFRMLCDPSFEQMITITADEKEPEVGKEVEIIHGPFSGIRGRLYRKQKKYWFVKTIAGVSVELRISRWYCKPI